MILGHTDEAVNQDIQRFFGPRIAVHTSTGVNKLLGTKGVTQGLSGILKSFGQSYIGKVVVRDSNGQSKSCNDLSVFFEPLSSFWEQCHSGTSSVNKSSEQEITQHTGTDRGILDSIEYFLKECKADEPLNKGNQHTASLQAGSLFQSLLKLSLASGEVRPYNGFLHPVACAIAISSRDVSPIETLRDLYAETTRANELLPNWLDVDFLRYYVLVHDEDNDDIAESSSLFELMKRHFGPHCHLLRLQSSLCASSDQNSVLIPAPYWTQLLTIKDKQKGESCELYESQLYLSESDALAINGLIREMVTQSVLPFMESRIAHWNDQIASKKRGLGGKFMSMSRKWTGLTGSRNQSATSVGASRQIDGFHTTLYDAETSESHLRQLAEYSLMLRDFKLATQIYSILCTDFAHDKAWAYHAYANEMVAITSLFTSLTIGNPPSADIDLAIETALYSYTARSGMHVQAIRCLLVSIYLLGRQKPPRKVQSFKWAYRLLNLALLGTISQSVVVGHILQIFLDSLDYAGRPNRMRSLNLWTMLASLEGSTEGVISRAFVR